MNKAILMACVAFLVTFLAPGAAWAAQDPPAYTNGQYYAWVTSNQAQAALDYINGAEWFPVRGKNKRTSKQAATGKQQTTNWCFTVYQTTNNLFVFPRIPQNYLDALGVPATNRTLFFDVFTPQVKPKKVVVFE